MALTSSNPVHLRKTLLATLLLISSLALTGCSTRDERAQKYFEKGSALLKKGEDIKAQVEFKNALQLKPNLIPAWDGLATVAEHKSDWNGLYGLLRKIVDMDPKNFDAQQKLGRLQLASGRYDEALTTSNTALELKPNDADILSLRATVLYKLGDKKGAVAQAEQALGIDKNNIDALVVLAVDRLDAGDARAALVYLDRGLSANEKHVALQLIKVQAFEALNQLDDAAAVYQKLLTYNPDSRPLHHGLAKFYLKHGEKEKAVAEYRAIVTAHPQDIEAKLDVARFLQQVEGPESAQHELEQLIAANPDNFDLRFSLVDFLQNQQKTDQQRQVLQDIMQRNGDGVAGLKAKAWLASLELSAGHRAEADRLITEVLARDQRNEQALLIKAATELSDHKLDDAIGDLRTILRDSPNNASAALLLARTHEATGANELAETYYLKAYQDSHLKPEFGMPYAEFLLRRGQTDRAGTVAEDLLRTQPNYLPALKLLAQTRISKGDWGAVENLANKLRSQTDQNDAADQIMGSMFAARQDYDKSIDSFKRAYDASPNAPRALAPLVRTYIQAGKVDDAVRFLNSVLQASPENAEANLLLGQAYLKLGDSPNAIKALQRAETLAPTDATAPAALATLYLSTAQYAAAEQTLDTSLPRVLDKQPLYLAQAGLLELTQRYDAAIQKYQDMLKQQPNSAVLANNLASLLLDHRKDEASLKQANDLAQRFRSSTVPQYLDTLGWSAYRLGRANEAVAPLQKATQQMPEQPVFHYHLGMVYVALNKHPEAKQQLQQAIEQFKRLGVTGLPEVQAAQQAIAGL